jgi:hypothetical protein
MKPGMVYPVLLLMFIIQTQPGISQHVAGRPYAVMSEKGCSTAFNTAPNRNKEQ